MLSEISQKHRQILYDIINYMWNLKKKKPNKLVNIVREMQTHRYKEQTSGGGAT